MSWVVFVAPENTSQADTILVGPFRSYDRAQGAIDRIERLHGDEALACMVMELVPPAEIPTLFATL